MTGRGFDCASRRHAESNVLRRWCRSIGACEPVAQKKSSGKDSSVGINGARKSFALRGIGSFDDGLDGVKQFVDTGDVIVHGVLTPRLRVRWSFSPPTLGKLRHRGLARRRVPRPYAVLMIPKGERPFPMRI